MSMASESSFPSPVGGLVLADELIPCIIFAVAYGVVMCIYLYQQCRHRDSATDCVTGTGGFVVERTVMFSLRAAVAANPGTESEGLTEYMQTTIALGFVAVAGDVCSILRCMLVASTRESSLATLRTAAPKSERSAWSLAFFAAPAPKIEGEVLDDPKRRLWYRWMCDGISIVFFASYITGTVGNARILRQREDEARTMENQGLRYASTALATATLLWAFVATVRWAERLKRTHERACQYMFLFLALMIIPAVYRLSVMYHYTTSLDSRAVGSMNTKTEKATFYVFHMLPEFIASFLLLGGINVREVFDTGRWGDSVVGRKIINKGGRKEGKGKGKGEGEGERLSV